MMLTLINCAFDGGGAGGKDRAVSGEASIRAAARRLKKPRPFATGRCSVVWFVSDPAHCKGALVADAPAIPQPIF